MEFGGGLSFDETLMEAGGTGVSIPVGVGRGRARGWPTEVEGKVERLGARGIEVWDGESWPAQRRRRGFAQLEPEEEEKGRKKKRRRPGRRG